MQGRGVLLTALALAACSQKSPPPPAAVDAVTIALATAALATGSTTLDVTGTVRLKRETQLGFSTAGRIAAITVLEGQSVAPGQMLARLDPTGLDAAMSSARAEAVRTEADRRRMAALLVNGWVTRSRMESAEAAAVAARSKVAETSFDARLGRIVAPVAGIILRRAAEPGQIVAAGTPVLTLGEVGSGYVLRLPVSDTAIAGVHLGQPAEVTLPALSPAPVAASVGEIAARGDDRTGTFQVELRLPAAPGMRSGLIGTARLAGPTITARVAGSAAAAGPVAVPASAVFSARADEGFVYVYRPETGTVATRLVRLGPVDDRLVTVTGGLAAGERVARTGVDRLRDGMKVRLAAARTP